MSFRHDTKIVSNLLYKNQKISQTGFISNKSMLTIPYQCMFFEMFNYFISDNGLKNFTDNLFSLI